MEATFAILGLLKSKDETTCCPYDLNFDGDALIFQAGISTNIIVENICKTKQHSTQYTSGSSKLIHP